MHITFLHYYGISKTKTKGVYNMTDNKYRRRVSAIVLSAVITMSASAAAAAAEQDITPFDDSESAFSETINNIDEDDTES